MSKNFTISRRPFNNKVRLDSDIPDLRGQDSENKSNTSRLESKINLDSDRLTIINSDINARIDLDSDRLTIIEPAAPIAWARYDFDSDGAGLLSKTVNNLQGYGVILDSDTDGGGTGVYFFNLDSDVVGGLNTYDVNTMTVVASVCNADAPPQFMCANVMNDYRVRIRAYAGIDHGAITLGDPVNTARIQFSVWGQKIT